MNSPKNLLDRQAAWQATRQQLSWPQKVRMAEGMREALDHFRRLRARAATPSPKAGRREDSALK